MMAIQHTDITIHGSNVVVLGLGRVGMSVARTFHLLGSKVKVGARKTEHIARITEMGLSPFHLNELSNYVSDTDILINTIPHLIVTAKVIAKMPVQTLIIDLASKPGGTDFRYAEKRGIKALLAPSLTRNCRTKNSRNHFSKCPFTIYWKKFMRIERRINHEFKWKTHWVWINWFPLHI